MIKILKEEKFEETDWNDVAQVTVASINWFIANLGTPKTKSEDSTPSFKKSKSSQSKKKPRND